MLFRKSLAICIVLSVGLDCFSSGRSLRNLAAEAILSNTALQEGLNGSLVPEDVKKLVGKAFWENDIPSAWQAISEEVSLVSASHAKVSGVVFLGTSSIAVSFDTRGVLKWWDIQRIERDSNGKPVPILEVETNQEDPGILAVSSDGAYLATAGSSSICVWERTGMQLCTLKTKASVSSLIFNKAGTQLAYGTKSGRLCVVDLPTKQKIFSVERAPFDETLLNTIQAVGFSSDRRNIYAAGYVQDRAMKIVVTVWDITTRACVKEIVMPTAALIGSIAFTDDDRALSFYTDGSFICTDVAQATSESVQLGNGIHSGVLSADGIYLLVGCPYQKVALWKRDGTGFALVEVFDCDLYVKYLAFFHDGRTFFSGDRSGALNLWSIARPMDTMTLEEAQERINSKTVSLPEVLVDKKIPGILDLSLW